VVAETRVTYVPETLKKISSFPQDRRGIIHKCADGAARPWMRVEHKMHGDGLDVGVDHAPDHRRQGPDVHNVVPNVIDQVRTREATTASLSTLT
jgi:hypothetical protein